MSTFRDTNWQSAFFKAAQNLKMNISGVEVVDSIDASIFDISRIVTYRLTNAEIESSRNGAEMYLARPLLERMILAGVTLNGEKLVVSKPAVRTLGSSDTVFNVGVRYAFVFDDGVVNTVEETVPVETEEERIKREEDEELERMQREEDARLLKEKEDKLASDEEERIKRESEAKAAEEQRLKDEETRLKTEQENAAAQEAARKQQLEASQQTGNSDEDQFPEEKV